MNTSDFLLARAHVSSVAIVDGERTFTYRQLRAAVVRLAAELEATTAVGDRVGVQLRHELVTKGVDAGADTIRWHLVTHHDVTVSRATIYRTLRRAGLVKPELAKRPKSSYISAASYRAAGIVGALTAHRPVSAHPGGRQPLSRRERARLGGGRCGMQHQRIVWWPSRWAPSRCAPSRCCSSRPLASPRSSRGCQWRTHRSL